MFITKASEPTKYNKQLHILEVSSSSHQMPKSSKPRAGSEYCKVLFSSARWGKALLCSFDSWLFPILRNGLHICQYLLQISSIFRFCLSRGRHFGKKTTQWVWWPGGVFGLFQVSDPNSCQSCACNLYRFLLPLYNWGCIVEWHEKSQYICSYTVLYYLLTWCLVYFAHEGFG
jgi:hypothetical protein